jgi:hypothetical protein
MAKSKKESVGLGDTIEKLTTATGIKAAVEMFTKATGVDCNCDKRKETLNKLFPYNSNINCLTESDYNLLTTFLDPLKNTLTPSEQLIVSDIYFNVFNYRLQLSSCGSCWKGKIDELRKVYNEYKLND